MFEYEYKKVKNIMIFDKFFNKHEIIDYDFCKNLPERLYPKYLMKLYKQNMGYEFDLKHPKTINEIIQYLKIYDNLPIKGYLSDKTLVNNYVENLLYTKKYTKEVYEIYNKISEVNFDNLPERFIIKMNNFSKANVIVYDKKSFLQNYKNQLIKFFTQRENMNYAFVSGFELQYKDIIPRIIVERLYPKVQEYQIICTNGRPLFIHFLDEKFNILNKMYELDDNCELKTNLDVKDKVEEMIEISKILSKGFKLVRVDFMLVNKQYIFFQELTFTPYSGFAHYSVEAFHSEIYGKKIEL